MMELFNELKRFLIKFRLIIRIVSYTSNIIALIVLAYWVTGNDIYILTHRIDHEPSFVILTTIFVSLNQLYRWLLEESQYSPAHSLATGYVNNFLSPTISQLMEDGEKEPIIYIYQPESITELYRDNVSRVKSRIKNDFLLNDVKLKLNSARARDIIQIEKSKTKKIYFDFPNTLLSLTSYVDYSIGSSKQSSFEKKKLEFTKKLLQEFYLKVDELLAKENISDNIRYCDKNLNFEF